MKRMLFGATALAAAASPVHSASDSRPLVTTQPDPTADVAPYFVSDQDPRWSSADWSAADIAALREKIKYVFVIFNENRSFDHEYGTFPGANGLYSDGQKPRSPADTPGFAQTYLDTVTGKTVTVQPFLVGPAQNASFKDSTDHSHKGLAAKIDVQDGVAKMDRFAEVEWRRYASVRRREGREAGNAVRPPRHGACRLRHDPLLLALRQPLHDLRQHLRHRRHAVDSERGRDDRRTVGRDPVGQAPGKRVQPGRHRIHRRHHRHDQRQVLFRRRDDRGPAAGQRPATVVGLRIRSRDGRRPPADRAGRKLGSDQHRLEPHLRFAPADDDGRLDRLVHRPGPQSGFRPRRREEGHPRHRRGRRPSRSHGAGTRTATTSSRRTRPASPRISATSATTTARNISAIISEQSGRADRTCAAKATSSPTSRTARCRRSGGVFYLRGGYYNLNYPRQTAVIQNPNYPNPKGLTQAERDKITRSKSGDDDHPSYSDSQLTEAMAARAINAIAANKDIWEKSAIVITYDEFGRALRSRPAADPELRPRRTAAGARHPHPADPDFALRPGACGVARRGRPQRGHRDDQRAVRPARALEPAGRKPGARRRRFAGLQRLRAEGLRAEISRAARHAVARAPTACSPASTRRA